MLSTTASYLSVASNLSRYQAATAAQPDVKSASAYYLANIGNVKSISDFVNNYQLFSYAMTAFGLSDMVYAKGLMTKVLEGGITDTTALANTLNDPRIKAFATTFDFTGSGASVTSSTSATTSTVSSYVEQALENSQGKQNQGVQLALYFQRNAPLVTSAYGLLADKSLLTVVQTAYGISPDTGSEDIDTQAAYLNKVLNISDLQNSTKVEQLVERFTASYDVQNGAAAESTAALSGSSSDSGGLSTDMLMTLNGVSASSSDPANALLATDTASSGLSSDLLLTIAGLPLGGT